MQLSQVLKLLTSNSENPYLLWDNSTRAELLDLLETHCAQRQPPNLIDLHFSYSSHATELLIGNVFVRLYNTQPAFPIKVITKYLYSSQSNKVQTNFLKKRITNEERGSSKRGRVRQCGKLLPSTTSTAAFKEGCGD